MDRQLVMSPRPALRNTGWRWTAAWIVVVLAGAAWVFRPAPSYVAPAGWTYVAETGPVLDAVPDGPDLAVVGRNGLTMLHEDGTVGAVALSGFTAQPIAFSIAREPGGRLWIGHESGLSLRTARGWITVDHLAGTRLNEVRGLAFDPAGGVWAGDASGVWKIDGAPVGGHFAGRSVLAGVRVLCLLADRDGGLWVGTDNGLYHRGAAADDWQSWSVRDGLPNRQVAAMMQDRQGRIWVGTGFHDQGGTLLFVRGPAGWGIERDIPRSLLAAPKTRSLFEDDGGYVWLGTETDGFSVIGADLTASTIIRGTVLPSGEVTTIGRAPNGRTWLGTLNGLLLLEPEAVAEGLLPTGAGATVGRSDGNTSQAARQAGSGS
ncbi:two-component regulator propeller domain-containing protein [Zhengella sp. ZM62]|uniref:ligand-binding sensor domain-containing protein n=1 Tax=Zhengella sedimenti TaxID=3390035 RepID=UPI0039765524